VEGGEVWEGMHGFTCAVEKVMRKEKKGGRMVVSSRGGVGGGDGPLGTEVGVQKGGRDGKRID